MTTSTETAVVCDSSQYLPAEMIAAKGIGVVSLYVSVDGVAVVVDKVSMQFVFGSEVDYVEGLQGAGFQVNNPNVVAACGCGSSFQVKEDAAEQAAAV